MRTRSKSKTEGELSDVVLDSSLDDDFALDQLLSQAKTNLATASKAKRAETDDSVLSLDNNFSETFKEIKESWRNLPKLESQLEATVVQIPKKGPVKFETHDEKTPKSAFRKVVDPVQVARQAKVDRESNAGDKWFNMPKPELTPTVKRDLQLLKMRNVLDRKRHYKKDDSPLPTFFQTGTVVEGNTEFYSARINRKDRRTTLADEILASGESKTYFKRKYHEVQMSKLSGRRAFYKKVKDARKRH